MNSDIFSSKTCNIKARFLLNIRANTAVAAALMLIPVLAGAADTLVLKEEAYVKGPTVLLGEVAEIEGENAAALANIEVGAAASPGDTKQLNAALVEVRLRNAGIDPKGVEIKGARSVRATTSSLELSKEMIAESLRAYIAQSMPWPLEDTDIEVPLPLQDMVVPEGKVELTWRPSPEYRFLGAGAFRGSVVVDGHPERSLLCKASINAYGTVLTAAGDIPRGRIICAADLATRKESLLTAPAAALLDRESAVGMVARRTIFTGQIITSRDIEARTLIKRNQLVRVEMQSGDLHIQTRAKTLMDGRAGDVVVCVNLNSQEQFQGVVRADGVVMVK